MATMQLTMDQSIELMIEQLQHVRTLTTDQKTRGYIDMAITRQNKLLKMWNTGKLAS